MSDAIDQIKRIGSESANNFINLVKSNPKASIAIGVVVAVLLILCCYLRRRCGKNAILVSRRQYRQLLKQMKEEEMAKKQRRSLRPSSTSALSPEQMQLKRLRDRDVERQALYLKQRQEKEAKDKEAKDNVGGTEKHFPVTIPDISLNTTHETDSSSDYDIESAKEESIEVTLDNNGKNTTIMERALNTEFMDDSSIFELGNYEKDMYASDRSEIEDRMHHRKKWFQSRPKKNRVPKL